MWCGPLASGTAVSEDDLFIGRDRVGIATRTITRGGHHLTLALAEEVAHPQG